MPARRGPRRANTSSLGLLRVEEVARELDTSCTTVRSLIREQKLRAMRYGAKMVRVHKDDLAAFVERARNGLV